MADKTNTIFRALDRKASAITEFTMRQYRTKINMGSIDYWFGSYQFTNAILRRRNAKRF